MSARRPLLTALGATTLLAALWFVPSANATAPAPEAAAVTTTTHLTNTGTAGTARTTGTSAAEAEPRPALALADTGGIDTAPYVLGGTLCLGLGAGFVTFSVRRSQAG
ncbi:hypothetical protein MTF65_10590 [Streptomyces sp. APSN-46.1]|uniref:hypothetical protein n=1 Tax=Streptomyces sp. APSN-46.1 TaxID=2929049 RepID=UPI001FB289FE|nr:hypothetical protein [Streptomyces sp. APSN-46.1]MCJ1677780.1 hypothetical protein [Streptomyces sp. APSN-46.1]